MTIQQEAEPIISNEGNISSVKYSSHGGVKFK